MSVDPNDILKVTMEVTLGDGSIAQNVYHFYAATLGVYGDSTITDAIEDWIETAYNELSADLVDTITQNVCTVQKVVWDGVLGKWVVDALVGYFTPTIVYNNASDPLPNQVSAFATFQTARPKSRGRKFLFPFGEDRQDATILSAPALADMADFAADVLTAIFLGPANNLYPGVVRAAAAEFLGFDVGIVTDLLGTQRRRRPGVGA